MIRATYLSTLGALLVLLLSSCRVVSPLGTPMSPSASPSPEPEELTTVRLGRGLQDLIWRWDHPDTDGRPAIDWGGDDDDDDDDGEAETAGPEFQRRFDEFCTDVGIVGPGEAALPLQAGEPYFYSLALKLPMGSRARKRILELNCMLDPDPPKRRVVLDLLVLEAPEKLTRHWGLDGFAPAGKLPKPFAGKVPSILTEEEFVALRSIILKKRGSRVVATASLVTSPGEEAEFRHVREVPVPTWLDLDTVDYIDLPGTRDKEGEAQRLAIPKPVPVADYGTDEAREVGVIFRGEASYIWAWGDRGLCTVDAEVEISGVPSWLDYGGRCPVRTPLVSSLAVQVNTGCPMGKTILVGRTFRERRESVTPDSREARRSCLLVFVTPRWLVVPPRLPEPENFASSAGQLWMEDAPGIFKSRIEAEELSSIDWGGNDDDDDGDDDGDDGYWEEWGPSKRARRLREFFATCGVGKHPDAKLLYIGSRLVFFAQPDEVQKMVRIMMRTGSHWPSLVLALLRHPGLPELWLETMSERKKEYGQSDRLLNEEDVRRFLRRVAKDKQSGILCSTALLAYKSSWPTLSDSLEVFAPVDWHQHLLGGESLWLPEFDESRSVGSFHHASSSGSGHKSWTAVELEVGYDELTHWVPCGPTLGFPQYRVSGQSEVVFDWREWEGKSLLIGGGGDGENPFVVWLIAAEWVKWW